MDSARLYLLLLGSGICCAALVPLVRRLAFAYGVVDQPGERRVNASPIPRLGGIAIFGGFLLILGLAWALGAPLEDAAEANPRGVAGFALGALIVFLGGIVDDVKGLRARTKLCLTLAAAATIVAYGGCRVSTISIPGGSLDLGPLGAPLTVLWIAGVTNALNLLDGLDGLAAGVAAIALGAILAIVGPGHQSVAVLSAVLIGASIGFLAHNFHPASIFMGDSGSLFLGYSLGVLSTYAGAKATAGALTVVPLLIVALPIADTIWAMGRRYVRDLIPVSARSHVAGIARMFVPDRKHIHHRLLGAGFAQRDAVYVLYGIQATACVAAIYLALILGSAEAGGLTPTGVALGPVKATVLGFPLAGASDREPPATGRPE